MNRSRHHFRQLLQAHVLPWVLGALVLRAMIPMGFMPAPGATTLAAVLCSTQGMLTEEIGIPGSAASMQCDFCLTPTPAGSPAHATAAWIDADSGTAPDYYVSPPSRYALDRAQTARAPPA